eukprot:6176403-Pleurochrysis_carterae.AAC.3
MTAARESKPACAHVRLALVPGACVWLAYAPRVVRLLIPVQPMSLCARAHTGTWRCGFARASRLPPAARARVHRARDIRACVHRARDHRACDHRACVHRARDHRACVHRACVHRARVHRARDHRVCVHRARDHRARVHRARDHRVCVHRAGVRFTCADCERRTSSVSSAGKQWWLIARSRLNKLSRCSRKSCDSLRGRVQERSRDRR